MTTDTKTKVVPPATTRQTKFLRDLCESRDLSDSTRKEYLDRLLVMSKFDASILIGQLIPMAQRVIMPKLDFGAGPEMVNEFQELLASVPISKYAIPNSEMNISMEDLRLRGDLTFIEVRKYLNRLYVKRLAGSLGDFTRFKVSTTDGITMLKIVNANPGKYARLFGENFKCCGCCGAKLTDQISRELQFGPDCRTKFGYERDGSPRKN